MIDAEGALEDKQPNRMLHWKLSYINKRFEEIRQQLQDVERMLTVLAGQIEPQ